MPVITNYAPLGLSACWNCWSKYHMAKRCPEPNRRPYEREQLRLKKQAKKPGGCEYDQLLKRDIASRAKLAENARATASRSTPRPIGGQVGASTFKEPTTTTTAQASTEGITPRRTDLTIPKAATVHACVPHHDSSRKQQQLQQQQQQQQQQFGYCSNCWIKNSHWEFNCPNPPLSIEEVEALRIKKGIPETPWWRNILLTARSNIAKQLRRQGGGQPVNTTEDLPKGYHPAIGYYTRACWNCWSTKHEKIECSKMMLSIREAENLRVQMGVEMPVIPQYKDMIAPYYCSNCWKTCEHLGHQCPEGYREVEEREKLRVKMGVRLTSCWRSILRNQGVEITQQDRGVAINRMISAATGNNDDEVARRSSLGRERKVDDKTPKDLGRRESLEIPFYRRDSTETAQKELCPPPIPKRFVCLADKIATAVDTEEQRATTPRPSHSRRRTIRPPDPVIPDLKEQMFVGEDNTDGIDNLIEFACIKTPRITTSYRLRTALAGALQDLRGLKQQWRDVLKENQ